MKCNRCESDRIFSICAKCSDMCTIVRLSDGEECQGYVPNGPLGGDDYLEFSVCAECGQMQSNFPATDGMFGIRN